MEGGKSMPRPGHVSQLRQNWSVFEDEAFGEIKEVPLKEGGEDIQGIVQKP